MMLIQCMEWNMATRQSSIVESELPELQQKAVELLDMLREYLPDKTGEKGKWNFEKAHSILHKIREIILWGNSDNCSCQSPEVCICTWYIHGSDVYIHVYTDINLYTHVLISINMYIQCTCMCVLLTYGVQRATYIS